jgi:anti-sigma factor RsiW
MIDHVDGVLSGRRSARVRDHLDRCPACREEEEAARLVPEALGAWRDVPPPEDGLHRLETRLAFAPPAPPPPDRSGRVLRFAIPYAAGIATAALVLLVAMPILLPQAPQPAPDPAEGTVVEADPGLRPGEVPLRDVGPYVVGPDERLYRIPDDRRRPRGPVNVPVEYSWR